MIALIYSIKEKRRLPPSIITSWVRKKISFPLKQINIWMFRVCLVRIFYIPSKDNICEWHLSKVMNVYSVFLSFIIHYLKGIKKCKNKIVRNNKVRNLLVRIRVKFALINSAQTHKHFAFRTNKFNTM